METSNGGGSVRLVLVLCLDGGRVRQQEGPRSPAARLPRRRRRRRPPVRPRPPEPVAEPTVVPPEPVRDDAISSASLDDLNRNSPLKPVFSSSTAAELSAEGQRMLDANAAVLKAVPGRSPSKVIATNAGPPSTIWHWANAGAWRPARIWCRSASRPTGCGRSATGRNFRSTRAMTRRRSPRTAARISSSRQSERMKQRSLPHPRLSFALTSSVARLGGRQRTAPDDGRHPHPAGAIAAAPESDRAP